MSMQSPPESPNVAELPPGRSRRKRRLILSAIGVVLVLALGVGGAVWSIHSAVSAEQETMRTTEQERLAKVADELSTSRIAFVDGVATSSPRETVSEYLDLLKAGDATAALELANATPTGNTQLLNTAAYESATYRIGAPHITEMMVDGNRAEVTAVMASGGVAELKPQNFLLVRADAQADWRLLTVPTGTIKLSANEPGTVTVSGVNVTELMNSSTGRTGSVSAFPGKYRVNYRDPAGLFTAKSMDVVVAPGRSTAEAKIETTVSDAGMRRVRAAATKSARAWADACLKSRFTGSTCSTSVKKEGKYISNKAVTKLEVSRYPAVTLTRSTAASNPRTFTFETSATLKSWGWGVGGVGIVSRTTTLNFRGTTVVAENGTISTKLGF